MGALEVADGPYVYLWVALTEGETYPIDLLKPFTVFCTAAGTGTTLAIDDGARLAAGDSVQVENRSAVLRGDGGPVQTLIAGTRNAHANMSSLTVTQAGRHYKVTKPWGHELWINGEHPGYCFKEVFIRAGNAPACSTIT